MSKALAILFTGVGASTVAVGGVVLTKELGNGKSDAGTDQPSTDTTGSQTPQSPTVSGTPSAQTNDPTITTAVVPAKSLFDFKTGTDKFSECTKHYFSSLSISDQGEELSSSSKLEATHFSNSANEETTDPRSCLIINWKRTDSSAFGEAETTSTNKKWKGDFRLEWSFVNGNKGFVLFATTKQSATEKQLDMEGGIYILKKDNENWTVEKKRELEASSEPNIKDSNFENGFPAVGEAITGLTGKDYWGFITGKSDLETVCTSSEDCPTSSTTQKTFKGAWLWQKTGSHKLHQWCKNTDTCLFYICDGSALNLKDSLESFNGQWKQSKLVQTPSDNSGTA